MDEAVHTAAKILTDAKYPLLFGWSSSTSEAQRIGVQLAEELGSASITVAAFATVPQLWLRRKSVSPQPLLGKSGTAQT